MFVKIMANGIRIYTDKTHLIEFFEVRLTILPTSLDPRLSAATAWDLSPSLIAKVG